MKTEEEIAEELHQEITAKWPAEDKKDFYSDPWNGGSLAQHHLTLGMQIRNIYKLWDRPWVPELNEQGVDYSPNHPDAVSMRILEEVWKKGCLTNE